MRIVTITYTNGRVESSQPLRTRMAEWFAAMMRASRDILRWLEASGFLEADFQPWRVQRRTLRRWGSWFFETAHGDTRLVFAA